MIGGLPDSTARALGEMILHTVEALAAVSLVCGALTILCLTLARRRVGGRATLLRWLAFILATAAIAPPAFVVWAVSR